MPNPYEEMNRHRKARAIADALVRVWERDGHEGSCAVAAAGLTPQGRFLAEQYADVVPLSGKPASDETWKIVIRLLQDREVGGALHRGRGDEIPSDNLTPAVGV